MNYKDALELIEQGKRVRLPEWTGYWFKELVPKREGDKPAPILAFTRTGDIALAWTGEELKIKGQYRTDWQEVTEGLGFDFAILAVKDGKYVCRKGWNGKGMYLALVPPGNWTFAARHDYAHMHSKRLPWIGMKTADGSFVPWLASQTDMLATDWEIANLPETA